MPFFEFRCRDCNKEYELFRKQNDIEIVTCPHCHSKNQEQCLSAPNFNLKGDGFYKPSSGE